LLADDEDGEKNEEDQTPIWLNLTTKKHIVDKKRLKPSKILLPHPINNSQETTICLITADPQRTFKNIVASPAFPPELAKRITRVIGVQKIKAKYHQYEAQRQLLAEHDVFLADDRIITHLPKLLGKTFYKSTTKRPIPVSLQAPAPKTDGKRIAKAKSENGASAAEPKKIAAEIERTFNMALVNLSPSTSTSVRIGLAGWDAQKIADNIETVTNGLVEKFVPKKWRGVRAIHIKGPNTAALPIWLADELWTDDADVLEIEDEVKAIDCKETPNVGKKRKAVEGAEVEVKKEKKAKKAKVLPDSDDTSLDKEIAMRKEKLRKQKEAASADVDDAVPMTKSKGKKSQKTAIAA